MPTPFLERIVAQRSKRSQRGRLNDQDKLAILLCLHHRTSLPRIARTVGTSLQTIERHVARFRENPAKHIFGMEVYQQSARGWECGFCGTVKQKEAQVIRHVMEHVLPREVARDAKIDHIPRRL